MIRIAFPALRCRARSGTVAARGISSDGIAALAADRRAEMRG